MDQKLPTIKEIAKKLNISISTVSRALHNHPRIGLRTKMQVQKLALELNYEPNTLAISFKQKKWFTLGVILPELSEQFFSQAISGIEDFAVQNGYNVLIGQSHESAEREKLLIEAFRKHRVDGILISVSKNTSNYEHLEVLRKYNIPVVFFDRIPKNMAAHTVSSNIQLGAEKAVDYLINKGHKRIAILKGPDNLIASEERALGYAAAFKNHKLKPDASLVKSIDLSTESTHAAINELLALKNKPTAILCFNDYVCLDAIQQAKKAKIKINKDISFVSFANLQINSYLDFPPLASVEQHPYQQGQLAAGILLDIIDKKRAPDDYQNIMLESELRIF